MKKLVFEALGTDLVAVNKLLKQARTTRQKLNIINAFKYYITGKEADEGNKLALLANQNDMIFWSLIRNKIEDSELEKTLLVFSKETWELDHDYKLCKREHAIELATHRNMRYMFDLLAGGDDYSKRKYNEREQESYQRIFIGYTKPADNTIDTFYLDDQLLNVEGIY